MKLEDKGWIAAAKYGSIKKLLKGEVGELHGVRFMESTNIVESGESGAKTASCFIYGADSYGVVDMEGGAGKPSIITKDFGSSGVQDPLDQRASVGWKNMFVAKVLDANAIYKVTTNVVD
jgi:N4-gp56 family major capsid protein